MNDQPRALATARWANENEVKTYAPGDIWFGRLPNERAAGFSDDRHVMLVSGSRSGKGTSSIVTNLCLWPGSMVVIDPKGENATIVAPRRGGGSEYCDGMGQKVFVLDPFSAARVDESLRGSYNPLDSLDPDGDETVDDAGRIADALVVIQNSNDPFWEEQARSLIKGVILHVITDEHFEGRRNLVTVRRLISSGDTEMKAALERVDEGSDVSAFDLLFEGMRRNKALHGIIAGAGEHFGTMSQTSSKTFSSVLSAAANHTEFIDSLPMQRILSNTTSGLDLKRLKTDPEGVSIFLSLPQRFMNTHFRWLRMMVSLVITEMEQTPGRPAAGAPVLLCLDEFAGLKRMEIIENAAAQIAGFGVKMFFVLQTLTQLKALYKENWEVFLANAGTKVFFGIEDMFTREYISKMLGESEISRVTANYSTNQSRTTSTSYGDSWSSGGWFGTSGTNSSTSSSDASGSSSGVSQTLHKRALLTPDEVGEAFARVEDKTDPRYPGLALVTTAGRRPAIVRRTNYFEDYDFERRFQPHPDHPFIALPARQEVKKIISPEPQQAKDMQGLYSQAKEIFPSLWKARPFTAVQTFIALAYIGGTISILVTGALFGPKASGVGLLLFVGVGGGLYGKRYKVLTSMMQERAVALLKQGHDAESTRRSLKKVGAWTFVGMILGLVKS